MRKMFSEADQKERISLDSGYLNSLFLLQNIIIFCHFPMSVIVHFNGRLIFYMVLST